MTDLERVEKKLDDALQKIDRLLGHLNVDKVPRHSHAALDERARKKAPAILLKFERKGTSIGRQTSSRKKLAEGRG
jgi:hypothetical protein